MLALEVGSYSTFHAFVAVAFANVKVVVAARAGRAVAKR